MDIYQNVSVSGALPADFKPETVSSPASTMLEFFPGENMEGGGDVSLEWLSIFVEDCLTTNYYTSQPLPTPPTTTTTATTTHPHLQTPPPSSKPPQPQNPKPSFHDLVIPAKSRTKRRKINSNTLHTFHVTPSDPPLLHQTYWLADSELIFPKKEQEDNNTPSPTLEGEEEEEEGEEKMGKEGSLGQPRRCTHCLSQRTPQWRAGPMGPKTLCNACGVRFKSGRLLPEYRPAKSPTFVSYKHSNSHKKVMEMRMASN